MPFRTPSRATASSTHTSQSYTHTASRPVTGRQSKVRSRRARPRTAVSTIAGLEYQQVICALSESRGVSPTVGLAFVNLDTCEAVMCQISDSQTYVKTMHKLNVYAPSVILFMSTAVEPNSKLFSIIDDDLGDSGVEIAVVDRRYFAEDSGSTYIQQLALKDDVEAIRLAVSGNYFAVCSLSAALKYVEFQYHKTFAYHSLRIKYEPPEGSMMIDISTIYTLELIQNLQDPKSRACLFGLLNEAQTPMGSRYLKSNILQPLTDPETLNIRYDALEELTTKEEMFFGVRQGSNICYLATLPSLTLVVVPTQASPITEEQNVNNVIMLRQFIISVKPIFEALRNATSPLLSEIRDLCSPQRINPVQRAIDIIINEDVRYSRSPLDLLNQRTFAVKSGLNGLLDVSRSTFKENSGDAVNHIAELIQETGLDLELKYDPMRRYFIRLKFKKLPDGGMPENFINVIKRREWIECSTLTLVKRNQRLVESHNECLSMSDKVVQDLIINIRINISDLFKICEGLAMLDMVSGFAELVTLRQYVRPQLDEATLAIKAGRHPIKEKIHTTKFVPNDVYASQQNRFQIVTGCNMSGKSTYIRSVALMVIMAQIGSFVPADFATFPIHHQLFARVSVDDSIEGNVSTFASEMQETAFILRNIDKRSIAIIDELGRGTSTMDGLAIAIAVAEALIDSRALVWFATHFTDLTHILSERAGVISLHLAVDMPDAMTMNMLYRVASGPVREEHYGLALARVLPLPPAVLRQAEIVAKTLKKRIEKRRSTNPTVFVQRRRRLVMGLREHLVQAKNGKMEGEELRIWLKELQREFVSAMGRLDEEALLAGEDEEGEEDEERVDTSAMDDVDMTSLAGRTVERISLTDPSSRGSDARSQSGSTLVGHQAGTASASDILV